MAEEEIIPEVEQQQPPQLQPHKEEKKKPERQPKKPPIQQQKKQQQQQQQIKDDEKEKGKTALTKEDKEFLGKLEDTYNFEWKDRRSGAVVTRVGNDIIFIRKIPSNKEGFAKFKNGPYLILKTNAEKFKKFKDKEAGIKADGDKEKEGIADDDEEEKKDDIIFEYFNFSKDYFNENEQLFADSLKQKKFLFNNLGKDKKDEEKKVQYFGWNEFKKLDIIPGISNKDKDKYKEKLENFNVENIQDNLFVRENAKKEKAKEEKDLFGIDDEEQIQENEEEPLPKEPLPKKDKVIIEDDIYNSDSEGMIDTEGMTDTEGDIQEFNVPEINEKRKKEKLKKGQQIIQAQNNQLINAGHTPNGEELRALIKYNNNSDSLLKLIVSLSNDNKGEVDFKEIGEIQDLNGDITNLYSDMQELKSKINSSNNAEEKEKLLIKYNTKRLKLEDLIKKYSKEAYRLSTLKKKKATMATHKYLMNKLNKLK